MVKEWTEDEIEQLELMVTNLTSWNQIAMQLGRSVCACKSKWLLYKNAKIATNKMNIGKWNEYEIQTLTWAYGELGPNQWNLVASHVHSRTPKQCKRKIATMMHPRRRCAHFSAEEMEDLESFGPKFCSDKYPYRTKLAWRRASNRLAKKNLSI